MQFILGIIVYVVLGVATYIVAHFISSIIGYDGMIVYIVAYAIVIALSFYFARWEKSNKEKNLIKKWSQGGYKSAIALLNNILPGGYSICNSEESIFERLFSESLNEAKKEHFDTNAEKSNYDLLKNPELWLITTLRDYCKNHCSWEVIKEGQIQMLKYAGEYSTSNDYFDRIEYYDKYEFTASGIIAEKIFLANAKLTDDPDALFQSAPAYMSNIDKGWVSALKRFEDNDKNM